MSEDEIVPPMLIRTGVDWSTEPTRTGSWSADEGGVKRGEAHGAAWATKVVPGETDPRVCAEVVLPDGKSIIREVPYYAAEVIVQEHNRAERAEARAWELEATHRAALAADKDELRAVIAEAAEWRRRCLEAERRARILQAEWDAGNAELQRKEVVLQKWIAGATRLKDKQQKAGQGIAELQAERKQLKADLKKARQQTRASAHAEGDPILLAEIDGLRAALAYYANPRIYAHLDEAGGIPILLEREGRAVKALDPATPGNRAASLAGLQERVEGQKTEIKRLRAERDALRTRVNRFGA